MFKAVIKREILDHLLSLRFIVGLILCIAVTFTCVIILTHDYDQELKDYNQRIAMQDNFLNNYAHANRIGPMIRLQKPPEQFRPLIIGMQKDADLGSFDDNPLPILFPPLDLVFIVTIIMSLMAILFSYDAICGEREKGTLKLMVSTGISRANILFGKWIGGTISLTIPFILSLLMGLLYITFHPRVQWTGTAWITFILLIIASITFISVFYLMGLLVSAFSRISSVSILTSLFIWVLMILAIPNLSPYLAAQFFRIPSVNRIEKEISRLTGIERDNLGKELVAEVADRFKNDYGVLFSEYAAMNREEVQERLKTDTPFKTMYEAYRAETGNAWKEANRLQGEKANQIRRELNTKAGVQTWVAKHIACLSPYANFVYLATDLSGTGIRSLQYFQRMQGEFFNQFVPYLNQKEQAAREQDPTYNSNMFIDISDRPRFQFQEERLAVKLVHVLPYWGLLLFFNVLFLLIAYTGFIKYDVR